MSVPSVKQHLTAIRMLFDYLVVGQVLPMNPAPSVRGPNRITYAICVLEALREQLRCKEIWVIGANRYRNRGVRQNLPTYALQNLPTTAAAPQPPRR